MQDVLTMIFCCLQAESPFTSNRLPISISSFQRKTTWYYTAYLNMLMFRQTWRFRDRRWGKIVRENFLGSHCWDHRWRGRLSEQASLTCGHPSRSWKGMILCHMNSLQCSVFIYHYSKRSKIKSFPWSTLPLNPKVILWTVQESPIMFVMIVFQSEI